jgi:hypothetical protein
MILALICLAIGLACGFAAGVKNAKSSKIAKIKEVAEVFKSDKE